MFYDQAVSSNPAEKLLKEALVWLQPSGIEGESGEDAGSGVTAWRNSGTGGGSYDMDDTSNVIVSSINGRKACGFGGVDGTYLRRNSITIQQPFTLAVVFEFSGIDTTNYVVGGRTLNTECAFIMASSDKSLRMYAPTSAPTGIIAQTNTIYIAVLAYNGSSSTWIIGDNSGSVNPGTASHGYGSLGAAGAATGLSVMSGSIGESLIWSRLLSIEEQSEVKSYLDSQWLP